MKNVLTGERSSASVDCQAKVKNNSATIGSGNNLKLSKISALENSCTLSGSLSLSEHSSVIASSANSHDRKSNASPIKVPSALLKRKAESTKSKLSDSRSTPNAAVRYLMKGKELGHPRFSTQSLSLSNNLSCISSSSLSKGSTLRPKSRAKQPSKDTEIHLDTPVTLRVTGSQDEEKQSPFLMNNLHIKSILYQQNEGVNSPDQPSTPSLTATSHAPTESRKKLKASCLRMPSPKIGFFDEDKSTVPTMGRSFQLHFEMQCTPHCKPGYSNRKLRPGKLVQDRTSSEIRCIQHVSRSTQLLHPAQDIIKLQHVTSDEKLKSSSPEVWSTMKSVSDVGLRLQSGTCGEIEEKICSKCRRVDQSSVIRQDDERRRVKGTHSRLSREAKGQRTDPVILPELSTPTKKEKNGCNQHDTNNLHSSVVDQVNDISRYFEAIDLSRDMVMDNKEVDKDWPILHVDSIVSKSNGNNIVANDQKKQGMMPNTFSDSSSPSLPGTEFSPSLRTPLADKTSIGNGSGSLIQSTTKEKLAEKPSKFPCQDVPSYKENTCPI
ncbi:hypothetical protein ACH5RR_018778 [Cinchona calisaya]|uniref:Uncharacterized protein n=1 Tax=Cinchona calisaya TaxID=153742 RepID=A0ABD2ZMV4_9GENT